MGHTNRREGRLVCCPCQLRVFIEREEQGKKAQMGDLLKPERLNSAIKVKGAPLNWNTIQALRAHNTTMAICVSIGK